MALTKDEEGRSQHRGGARAAGTAEDREPASIVTRVTSLLHAVAESGGTRSVAELAARVGLPKPTVHRLCQQLEAAGYLTRDFDTRQYTVSHRLWDLGLSVVSTGMRPERRAILQGLVDVIGETCNLSTRVRDQLYYVDRVEARWPLRMNLEPGSFVPLHCTASGKLFLSDLSRARRERLIAASKMTAYTPKTITDPRGIEDEMELIRKRGYSIDNEEFLDGLVAVAVPVRNAQNRIVAGIACHGPTVRFSLETALAFLPKLKEAAAAIEATLEGDSD